MNMESIKTQTVAFKSLGCKLNQYEVQALREELLNQGFIEVQPKEVADYYILNTCTVTAGADSEARYLIRSFRRINAQAKIVVTGCYAEANPDELAAMLGVEWVVSNKQKNQIPYLLTNNKEISEEESPFFKNGISFFEDKSKAFVKVQDGCNYFCTFCKIPFVRGRLVSRDDENILQEVQRLSEAGYQEIILSGVCLGSYGRDVNGVNGLSDLIKRVLELPGDFRIRLSSIDPRDTPLEIADLMRDNPRLCPHLHLSLQSGSETILKSMKRGYAAQEYLELVTELRKRVPNIGLTTDIIIGFPGETEALFNETYAFIKKLRFNHIHFFSYSDRDQTKSTNLPNKVNGQIIKARMKLIREEQSKIANSVYLDYINQDMTILVELQKSDGSYQGYSEHYLKCQLPPGNYQRGDLRIVRAKELDNNKKLCLLTY
ncbi:MAG: threonylcarbamoyladenosine tRNA methylthiotransferase MtaB [Candidatus Omnitrophota bacterium]|jgi:threonylcarbamoyladenosine tRNA methylthiotransferase MtaB